MAAAGTRQAMTRAATAQAPRVEQQGAVRAQEPDRGAAERGAQQMGGLVHAAQQGVGPLQRGAGGLGETGGEAGDGRRAGDVEQARGEHQRGERGEVQHPEGVQQGYAGRRGAAHRVRGHGHGPEAPAVDEGAGDEAGGGGADGDGRDDDAGAGDAAGGPQHEPGDGDQHHGLPQRADRDRRQQGAEVAVPPPADPRSFTLIDLCITVV
ncbi:hypothetical protein GCM10020256_15630 [Streptomyces thermocoprophilus]